MSHNRSLGNIAFKTLLDVQPHPSPQPLSHNVPARWKISSHLPGYLGNQDSIHEVLSAWSYSTHRLALGYILILQVSDQTTLPLEASLDPLRFPEVPCWLLTECLPRPDYNTYHIVPVMPAYQSSVSISPKGQRPC